MDGTAKQPAGAPLIDARQPVVFRVGALGAAYWPWVNSPEGGAPRFFASPWAEACSKTPWWVVPALWLPAYTALLAAGCAAHGLAAGTAASLVLVGVVAWQLMEYAVHRHLFHAHALSYWGITAHFLFHGCHHKYPMDKLRLVFPPLPAALIMLLVYATLRALLPPPAALCVFVGMGYGYIAYDCIHYGIHHGRLPLWGLLDYLRARHTHHHFHNCTKLYGISSVVFDVLLGTDISHAALLRKAS